MIIVFNLRISPSELLNGLTTSRSDVCQSSALCFMLVNAEERFLSQHYYVFFVRNCCRNSCGHSRICTYVSLCRVLFVRMSNMTLRGPLGRLAKLAKGATLWKYCMLDE